MRSAPVLGLCLMLAGPLLLTGPLLLASPVCAQPIGETSGVNATLGIAPRTGDFVSEAAASDMFEIAASKLAAERTSGDVQGFASQMVTDHGKTASELNGLAEAAKISLPITMTGDGQSMLTKLQGLQGQEFAKQYMDDQVRAHKEAVSLFERYGKSGDNEQLKSWASRTLPTLQHHLDMAEKIDGQM